jgi:ubiquinone biosynthesis protein UbiJ
MNAQSMFPNRREFTRIRIPITALVTINGATLRLPVRDLSLEGIGVHVATSWEEGAACTVEVRREDAPEIEWITARGTVARVAPDTVGIQFLDLVGIDSLHHLRALIMYHAEDPDQVVAEFDAHWGIRRR